MKRGDELKKENEKLKKRNEELKGHLENVGDELAKRSSQYIGLEAILENNEHIIEYRKKLKEMGVNIDFIVLKLEELTKLGVSFQQIHDLFNLILSHEIEVQFIVSLLEALKVFGADANQICGIANLVRSYESKGIYLKFDIEKIVVNYLKQKIGNECD